MINLSKALINLWIKKYITPNSNHPRQKEGVNKRNYGVQRNHHAVWVSEEKGKLRGSL